MKCVIYLPGSSVEKGRKGKERASQLFTTQQGAVGKEPHSASYGSMEKGHFCPAGLCK